MQNALVLRTGVYKISTNLCDLTYAPDGQNYPNILDSEKAKEFLKIGPEPFDRVYLSLVGRGGSTVAIFRDWPMNTVGGLYPMIHVNDVINRCEYPIVMYVPSNIVIGRKCEMKNDTKSSVDQLLEIAAKVGIQAGAKENEKMRTLAQPFMRMLNAFIAEGFTRDEAMTLITACIRSSSI